MTNGVHIFTLTNIEDSKIMVKKILPNSHFRAMSLEKSDLTAQTSQVQGFDLVRYGRYVDDACFYLELQPTAT